MEYPTIDKNRLAAQFGTKISRLAHRMIKNNALAQEAAQEVWYEIIRSLPGFNGASEISTWIFTIAKRTILKYAHSEKVYNDNELHGFIHREPIEYSGEDDAKKQWVKEKCDSCLTAFCHCLNNEARLIFLFRDIASLSYRQISVIMEMKEDNVRQIASRSKEKVRRFMERNCVLFNPNADCKCRIRKHVLEVNLPKAYGNLEQAARLVDFFLQFDNELPRKNYWEKFVSEDVTN